MIDVPLRCGGSSRIAIEAVPASVNFLEATGLVQAIDFAIDLEARYKLDNTRSIIARPAA